MKNIWFLIKQGTKIIFSFKVQFIMIILLSFLSSFIISSTMNLNSRLLNNYNSVVGNVKKFDFVSDYETKPVDSNVANKTTTSKKRKFIPFLDFTNAKSYINYQTDNIENSYVNFVLNDKYLESLKDSDGYNISETLATRIFNNDEFKNLFLKILKNNDAYKGSFQNIFKSSDKITKFFLIPFMRQTYANLVLFINSFQNNDFSNKDYLLFKNTLIGNYIKNSDSEYLNNLISDSATMNDIFKKAIEIIDLKDWNLNNIKFDWNENEFIQKLYLNFQNMDFFIYLLKTSRSFLEQIFSELNVIYEKYANDIKDDFENENIYNKDYDNLIKAFYTFLTGSKFNENDGSEIIKKEWLVNNFDDIYELNTSRDNIEKLLNSNDPLNNISKKYLIVNDINNKKNTNQNNIYKKGLKGNVNNLIINIDFNDKKVYSINNAFLTDKLKLTSDGEDWFDNMTMEYDDNRWSNEIYGENKTNKSIKDKNIKYLKDKICVLINYSISHDREDNAFFFKKHINYSAIASNFDVEFRQEYYDINSKENKKYRFIYLDNNVINNHLKIYEGTFPKYNEVLISLQYAREFNINIGDYINVLNGVVRVSGFATDTYSFVPVSDNLIPIPQPNITCILYAVNKTINKLYKKTINFTKDNTSYYGHNYYFLRSKNNNLQKNINLFKSYQFLSEKNIYTNIDNIYNNKDFFNTANDQMEYKSFNDSIFRINWTYFTYTLWIYNLVSIFAILLIIAITIFVIVIYVKKMIIHNANQIAIIKSLGINNFSITFSYISIALVMLVLGTLPGFIISLVTQSGLLLLFLKFFSFQIHIFEINFLGLFLEIFLFVITSLFIIMFSTFLIIKKPVLEITNNKNVWKKPPLLAKIKKLSFYSKINYDLQLSITTMASDKKNIILLLLIIIISTFLTMLGFSIPSIAENARSSYFSNINYANEFKFIKPTINSPLSKGTLNYWNGHNSLENSYVKNKDLNVDYYKNPEDYSSYSFDAGVISKYIYNNKYSENYKIQNSLLDVIRTELLNDTKNKNGINLFVDMILNNILFNPGKQISIGAVEEFKSMIFNLDKIPLINNEKEFIKLSDKEKVNLNNKVIENLGRILSSILENILNIKVDTNSDDNWKETLIEILKKDLPLFVSQFLNNSPSRVEQFAISYNVEHVIPQKETLATILESEYKNKNFDIIGLSKSQNAYKLNDNAKNKLFIDNNILNKLEKVLLYNDTNQDNDIINQNFKYYDHNKKEINIPIMINKQAKASFGLGYNSVVSNIKSKTKVMEFLNNINEYEQIPNGAYIYNDIDFINSDYYNTYVKNSNYNYETRQGRNIRLNQVINEEKQFLDPFDLDSNKFTYKKLFKNNNNNYELIDYAQLFDDFIYDDNFNDIIGSYIRPVYSLQNIELYFPKSKLINPAAFILRGTNENDRSKTWYDESVSYNKVPKSVINAWNIKDKSTEFIMVKPYDLNFWQNKNNEVDNITVDVLSNPYAYTSWIMDVMKGKRQNQNDYDAKHNIVDNTILNNDNLKINFVVVDELSSYNTNIIIADQNIINFLSGMSKVKKIPTKYNYLDKTNEIKDKDSIFKKYEFKKISPVSNKKELLNNDLIFFNDERKEKILDNSEAMWHNYKFSNIEEPTNLTNGISFVSKVRDGYENTWNKSTSLEPIDSHIITVVENQTLLSIIKKLISDIAYISISIAMMFIVTIIILAVLLLVMITDIYSSKYKKFILMLKSFGYSNAKIIKFIYLPNIILAMGAWSVGAIINQTIVSVLLFIMFYLGIALPNSFIWWMVLINFILIMSIYLITIFISYYRINKTKLRNLVLID